jgi:hypothetical protein
MMPTEQLKVKALAQIDLLETKYPALSDLALSQGSSFTALVEASTVHSQMLRLSDCCLMGALDAPRWGNCDHASYLATLELMVTILPEEGASRKKLWKKISTGSESKFLDTVAEAAWAIHFSSRGILFTFEEPLDPGDAMPKDADFVLRRDGKTLWLDSYSIQFNQPPTVTPRLAFPFMVGRSREISMNVFQARAHRKYDDKFKWHVNSGALQGQHTGILLSILKAEKELLLPFFMDPQFDSTSLPPSGLFTENRPGLASVTVTNFVRVEGNEHLSPNMLFNWMNPAMDSLAFLMNPALIQAEKLR